MTDSQQERQVIADEIESKLRPLVSQRVDHRYDGKVWVHAGGYDCCGCSTYDQILDDAIAVVLGTYVAPNKRGS